MGKRNKLQFVQFYGVSYQWKGVNTVQLIFAFHMGVLEVCRHIPIILPMCSRTQISYTAEVPIRWYWKRVIFSVLWLIFKELIQDLCNSTQSQENNCWTASEVPWNVPIAQEKRKKSICFWELNWGTHSNLNAFSSMKDDSFAFFGLSQLTCVPVCFSILESLMMLQWCIIPFTP